MARNNVAQTPIKVQIFEPLTESSISVRLTSQESGLGRPLASLAGQMGCIYLFEDTLTSGRFKDMSAL